MHSFKNASQSQSPLGFDYLGGRICALLAVAGLVACSSGPAPGAVNGTGGGVGSSSGGVSAAGAGGSVSGAGNGAAGSNAKGGAGGATTGGVSGGGTSVGGNAGSASGGVSSAAGAGGGPPSSGGATSTGGAGGSDPNPPSGDAGTEVTLAELPLALADAACGALEQCLGAASSSFFDGGSCRASLEPATEEGSASVFAAAVSKGTLAYDPAKVPACLASIKSSGCNYPDQRLDALCLGVVTGKVALNGACSVNAECGASAYCKAGTCPGTCLALVAKGAACAADDDCQNGLVCDATAKKCLIPGKKSDACSAAAPCGSAFVCDATAHCVEFASVFAAKEGQACDPQGHALCAAGLTCALVNIDSAQKGVWSCQKPTTSASCHFALPEQCAAGSYCELSTTLAGTCKTAPAASAPCASRAPSDNTVAKDICAPGLSCWTDGTCHARAHLTEPCTTDDDCFSGTCQSKHCVAAACTP